MRVMVIVKATPDTEAGVLPTQEAFAAMGSYGEELVKAGILLDGNGLKPSSTGVRIRMDGRNRSVIDGPFAETKELIAGYSLWEVRSMDEAIEWAKRFPNLTGETELEIRPVFEDEDFGEAATPELREQDDRLRAEAAKRKAELANRGA